MKEIQFTKSVNGEHINYQMVYLVLFLIGLFYIEISEVLFILGLYVVIKSIHAKKFEMTRENILLLITFISYVFIDYFNHRTDPDFDYNDSLFMMIDAATGYLIGYLLLKNSQKNPENVFKKVMIVILTSTGLFAFLGLIFKVYAPRELVDIIIQDPNFSDLGHRWGINIWTLEAVNPTNFNNQFTFTLASSFGILFYLHRKFDKLILLMILLMGILSAILTSTRTSIFSILLSLMVGLILDTRFNQSEVVMKIRRFLTLHKWIILLSITFMMLIFFFKWSHILYFLDQSPFLRRFTSNNHEMFLNGRLYLATEVLKNLLKYPFGNMPLIWAHNLWLDVARISGLIPMTLLISYSISTFYNLLLMMKRAHINIYLKLMSVNLFFGVYLAFSLEPVIEGRQHLFMLFCMFNGMVSFFAHQQEHLYTSPSSK